MPGRVQGVLHLSSHLLSYHYRIGTDVISIVYKEKQVQKAVIRPLSYHSKPFCDVPEVPVLTTMLYSFVLLLLGYFIFSLLWKALSLPVFLCPFSFLKYFLKEHIFKSLAKYLPQVLTLFFYCKRLISCVLLKSCVWFTVWYKVSKSFENEVQKNSLFLFWNCHVSLSVLEELACS